MPLTQAREITAASRLANVRYAIRDLACVADEVTKQGHKVLPLNIGDPLSFDFQTPPHIIEAVHKAMRDGKNGYAPSEFAAKRRARDSRWFAMYSSRPA
ncbi:MAG: hypothetical protein DMG99_10420 [Acidobacteria bacterium]|nr:MAG: hypothetical protein DMG99_10420 [Acidobacteriota bacterium]